MGISLNLHLDKYLDKTFESKSKAYYITIFDIVYEDMFDNGKEIIMSYLNHKSQMIGTMSFGEFKNNFILEPEKL
ncbi:hypothetical protein [Yeosuana marina]|uniref:hypothetical protein n=1 Tax=Yeosuana marina TaxID=1565536 RepID=UPI0030EF0E06|tara:strand:+ start:839 stop:1063 length:225 start_codon:yes stop_codon:yes gene_type:complete